MITEDYVSFETAKLLKEKEFDWKCRALYTFWFDEVEGPKEDDAENWNIEPKYFSAPTLQMAMKWLREVHNQIIVPGISLDERTLGTISHYFAGIWYIPKNNGGAFCYTSPTPYNGYSTYEEACEAAIKYCLENLI